MLSKSAARRFFLTGTFLCFGAFILLTIDTLKRIPGQTNTEPEGSQAKAIQAQYSSTIRKIRAEFTRLLRGQLADAPPRRRHRYRHRRRRRSPR